MNFEELIQQIENIHIETQKYAVQLVNSSLIIRNILIGFFIVEFEQNGFDRADYGANTINQIAKRVKHIKGISAPQLYRFRDLYLSYPHILSAVLRKLENTSMISQNIFSTVSRKLEIMPKNETLVEYATAGLTNDVFVSKYQIELPSKEVLENFIRGEMKIE